MPAPDPDLLHTLGTSGALTTIPSASAPSSVTSSGAALASALASAGAATPPAAAAAGGSATAMSRNPMAALYSRLSPLQEEERAAGGSFSGAVEGAAEAVRRLLQLSPAPVGGPTPGSLPIS